MISILYVVTVTGIGGAERMLLALLRHLDHKRFRASVAALHPGGPLELEVKRLGVSFHELSLRSPLAIYQKLRRLIQQERIDIIQTYGLTADVVIRPLARRSGAKRMVSSLRGLERSRKWYHNMLAKLTRRYVDLWISNSGAGKTAAVQREHLDPQRVIVIPNGIDENLLAPLAVDTEAHAARFNISKEDTVILTVANIRPMKGHSDILAAIKLLERDAAASGNLKFVFVGEDRSGGEIYRLASRLGIQERVAFTGFHEDVRPFLRRANIFLFPSHEEGMGNALMEAMACGLPVIATRVGDLPELVREGVDGLLIEPRNPAAIAKALSHLLQNEEVRIALGNNAKNRMARDFKMEKMVRQHEQAYQNLMESSRVKSAQESEDLFAA